jgi:hypothetical protein
VQVTFLLLNRSLEREDYLSPLHFNFALEFAGEYGTARRKVCEPGSSVSIVSGYWEIEVRFPAEVKGFFL